MLSMYIYMYGIININTIEQVQYNESHQLNNVALEQTRERKRAHMEDGATSLLGVFQFQIKHGFMTVCSGVAWFVQEDIWLSHVHPIRCVRPVDRVFLDATVCGSRVSRGMV